MPKIILTVADHERNGFVHLAQWNGLSEAQARTIIAHYDGLVDDDAEPDIDTAAFTFILDLMSDDEATLIDTGKRLLPLQVAMAVAPAAVRAWLEERPDPDSVFHRRVPLLPLMALQRASGVVHPAW